MALVSNNIPGQPVTVSQKAAQDAFETPKGGSFAKKSTENNSKGTSQVQKKNGPISAVG